MKLRLALNLFIAIMGIIMVCETSIQLITGKVVLISLVPITNSEKLGFVIIVLVTVWATYDLVKMMCTGISK